MLSLNHIFVHMTWLLDEFQKLQDHKLNTRQKFVHDNLMKVSSLSKMSSLIIGLKTINYGLVSFKMKHFNTYWSQLTDSQASQICWNLSIQLKKP
jgi:hypothetical protein